MALANETEAQFSVLPVEIIPVGSEDYPYKTSPEMMDDVMHNGRLAVFTGGDDHPLFSREQNFKFRAVHDFFGHAQYGYAFGPRGEENAWIEHSKMFSPLARKAMTTETRGQNSYVNFGPFSHLPVMQRPYADQKVFVLPAKFRTIAVLSAAYREFPGFYPSRDEAANPVKLVKPHPGKYLAKPSSPKTGVPFHQHTMFEVDDKPVLQRKKKVATWCAKPLRLDLARKFFELGQEGLTWYDDTAAVIFEMMGRNQDRTTLYIKFLAATSPLTPVIDNVRLANHALELYDAFGLADTKIRVLKDAPLSQRTIWEREFQFDAHRFNLIRIVRGEKIEGPKVNAFQDNLLGDPEQVTVDRWMMRIFNDSTDMVNGKCVHDSYNDKKEDAPSPPEYRCIQSAIQDLAYKAGVQPRQYQAATWVGIKKMCGDPSDTIEPFHVILERIRKSPQLKFDFPALDDAYTAAVKRDGGRLDDNIEAEFAAFDAALGPVEQGDLSELGENPGHDESDIGFLTARILGY
ncbi:MAG: hypothetical protein GZ088_09840 [Acidipila sp.]|nr:hypothetical protein [Acidipila sp.]